MKVNDHQFKNAIAHVSKKVQNDFPNKKHLLSTALFEPESNYWRFKFSEPMPEGTISEASLYHVAPWYFAKLAEIGSDESISLDNIFIDAFGIAKVLDAGFGFMNHADKITSVSLADISSANSYLKRYPSWELRYSGLDNKQEEIVMHLYISNQGMIFKIELEYTGGKKAYELAENFIKQSDEIVNTVMTYREYYGFNTGIHTIYYKGFNQQGEVIKLRLKVDAKNEIILSHEITILKVDEK